MNTISTRPFHDTNNTLLPNVIRREGQEDHFAEQSHHVLPRQRGFASSSPSLIEKSSKICTVMSSHSCSNIMDGKESYVQDDMI